MCSLVCVFFFQAEDGIRGLVRSRGLGDVYKRQGVEREKPIDFALLACDEITGLIIAATLVRPSMDTVSYTHLTLPTSDLV